MPAQNKLSDLPANHKPHFANLAARLNHSKACFVKFCVISKLTDSHVVSQLLFYIKTTLNHSILVLTEVVVNILWGERVAPVQPADAENPMTGCFFTVI